MAYFRAGTARATHEAQQIDVAKTPLASFESNVSGLYLPEILAYIQATQSGTGDPSPSNPRAISGVSEVTTACNAINQWDEQWEVGSINTNTGQPELYGTNRIRSKNYIPCKGVQLYVVTPIVLYLYFYDANKNYLGSTSIITISMSGTKTFTPPAGAKYLKLRTNNNYGTTYNNDISINYPATDTAYHAYTGTTATTSLGGTYYGGYLNVTTGLLTILCKYLVFNSAEYYGTFGIDNAPLFYVDITGEGIMRIQNAGSDKFLISNMLSQISTMEAANLRNYEIRTEASDPPTRLYFRMDDYTSKADIDAFLANNPLQVVAELATPQTYQLTPAQIEQLLGQNNVFASTGDVAVKYWRID